MARNDCSYPYQRSTGPVMLHQKPFVFESLSNISRLNRLHTPAAAALPRPGTKIFTPVVALAHAARRAGRSLNKGDAANSRHALERAETPSCRRCRNSPRAAAPRPSWPSASSLGVLRPEEIDARAPGGPFALSGVEQAAVGQAQAAAGRGAQARGDNLSPRGGGGWSA